MSLDDSNDVDRVLVIINVEICSHMMEWHHDLPLIKFRCWDSNPNYIPKKQKLKSNTHIRVTRHQSPVLLLRVAPVATP